MLLKRLYSATASIGSWTKIATLGVAAAICLIGAAHAQEYPAGKPIKLIVPWPAGGVTDAASRILAARLGERLGTAVVVENRGGANGRIGADLAAKSPSDGYTLFVASAETHAINPYVFSKLTYDPVKDFVSVAPFAINPFTVVSRAELPASSLKEVIELARASPGKLTFASWGIGSTSQIGMEMLKTRYGLQMLHVPFQGEAPAVTALLAGQVDLMVLPAARANALRKDGKIKVHAVTVSDRFFVLPDVPSLRELGFEGIHVANWFGVVVPARTPAPIVQRLATEISAVVRSSEGQAQFRSLGVDVHPVMQQQEFQRFVESEAPRWGEVIRKANITLDG